MNQVLASVLFLKLDIASLKDVVGIFTKLLQRHYLTVGNVCKYWLRMGSGCCAVGRAVASDTTGPGVESSHWQLLLNNYLLLTICLKRPKINEKEAENGHFF